MEIYLAAELIAINNLLIVWALLHKKYVDTKQSIVLSSILALTILVSYFSKSPFAFSLLFIFYLVLASFIIKYTTSWILMALTAFSINSLTIISWLFSYDLLKFLFKLNILDSSLYQFLNPLSLLAQQLWLFLLILIVKYLDRKYLVSDAILHISKSYKTQSILALFLLIFLALIKQITVTYFLVESFFYLTIILLTLNLVIYSTAYLYSKYYQQQLKKAVLFELYNQDLKKIVISDEFRHDYRNILLSLTEYIEQGETSKALDYINSITSYSRDVIHDDPYSELSNLAIPPAQGLLLYLIDTCKQEHIQLNLAISEMIQEQDISIYLIDFLRCLSAIFDYSTKEAIKNKTGLLNVAITKTDTQIRFELTDMSIFSSSNHQVKPSKTYLKEHGLEILAKTIRQYEGTTFSLQTKDNHFSLLFTTNLGKPLKK